MLTNKKLSEEVFPALVQITQIDAPFSKVSYAMAKNLRRARAAVDELQDIRLAEIKKYAAKDDKGEPRYCLYDAESGRATDQEYKGGNVPEGKVVGFMYESEELKTEAQKAVDVIFAQPCEVEWHKVPHRLLQGLNVKGAVIEPLLDVIIFEEDED